MIIGERLKSARKEMSLSQQKLGDLIGVSKVSICGYEKGSKTPTMKNFVDLIDALELTPDYVLGRDVLVVSESDTDYKITMAKEDIEIIEELKKHPELYNRLYENPKRTIELINRRIK